MELYPHRVVAVIAVAVDSYLKRSSFGFALYKNNCQTSEWVTLVMMLLWSNLSSGMVPSQGFLNPAHVPVPSGAPDGNQCSTCAGDTQHQSSSSNRLSDKVRPVDEVEFVGVHQVFRVLEFHEDPKKSPGCY